MNEIKLYKELSYIETFDWATIAIDEDLATLKQLLNDGDKFLDLWEEILSKSAIKRIFIKKIDEIDNYILQNVHDKNLRSRVEAEVEQRRKQGARVNMEILKNIIERLKN